MKTRLLRKLRRKFSKHYTLEYSGSETYKYKVVYKLEWSSKNERFKTIEEAEQYKRDLVRDDIISWCIEQRAISEINKSNKKYLW